MTENETVNASVTELVGALVQLTRAYATDALALLRAEWKEKARSLRTLALVGGAAAILLLLSTVLLSLALVALVAFGVNSWGWALLIVGAAYLTLGLLLLAPLAHGLRSGLFRFDHTRERLKRDAEWVKHKLAA